MKQCSRSASAWQHKHFKQEDSTFLLHPPTQHTTQIHSSPKYTATGPTFSTNIFRSSQSGSLRKVSACVRILSIEPSWPKKTHSSCMLDSRAFFTDDSFTMLLRVRGPIDALPCRTMVRKWAHEGEKVRSEAN